MLYCENHQIQHSFKKHTPSINCSTKVITDTTCEWMRNFMPEMQRELHQTVVHLSQHKYYQMYHRIAVWDRSNSSLYSLKNCQNMFLGHELSSRLCLLRRYSSTQLFQCLKHFLSKYYYHISMIICMLLLNLHFRRFCPFY